jgi:vitamin B12 transporter
MKKSIFASLVGLAFTPLIFAADEINLNPIVVSGNRLEQPLSDVMTSISVITSEDLDRLQPQDVVSALQGEAGLELVRSGGLGMQTSIFMRGANSGQVLVLVDGLRITNEFTGSVPIENIPIKQIDRIEIIRGNASALYGSSAVGGVIQIFTKSGLSNLGPYGSISYGSRNTQNLVAGYNGKYNDTSFGVSYNHQQTDGFPTLNPAQNNTFSTANPSNNSYQSDNVSANISQLLAPGHEIGIKILASNSTSLFDSGTNSSFSTFLPSSSGFNFLEHSDAKTLLSQFYSKDTITDFWNSKVTLGVSNIIYRYNYNFDQSGIPTGEYNTHQTDFSWVNDFIISNNQTALLGLQSNQISTTDSDAYFGTPPFHSERTINSVFAGYTAKFDAIGVQLNARHDDISTGQSATTGLLGLSYNLTNHWKLAGNISNAFNAPTSAQLFSGPIVGGNPNLQPERDSSQEASLQYSDDSTLARVVVFNRDSKDLIAAGTTTSSDPICVSSFCFNQYENIAKAKNQGVEFTAKTNIDKIRLSASATFQDPMNEVTNTQLIRRTKEFASIDASYALSKWTVGSQLFISGPRLDTNFGTTPSSSVSLSGYSIVNLFANYQYDANWSAKLKIENLFDRSYQQSYGYNTPGFGAFLTLQYTPENK